MVDVTYDDEGEIYRARFTWNDATTPSTAIVETLAAIEGRDPTEYPPLRRCVNTDSLDELLRRRSARRETEGVEVEFAYSRYRIAVSSNGIVSVSEL